MSQELRETDRLREVARRNNQVVTTGAILNRIFLRLDSAEAENTRLQHLIWGIQEAGNMRGALADVWDEAYWCGVHDQLTADEQPMGYYIGPNRVNPYREQLTEWSEAMHTTEGEQ